MLPKSKYLKIFVDSDESIEVFATYFANLLHVQLESVTDNEFILYRYSDEQHRWFEIGTHPFENVDELNFEDYPYLIETGVFDVYDAEKRQHMLLEYTRSIFDALKASRKYHLILVDGDGLQIKLDEFAPAPQISK